MDEAICRTCPAWVAQFVGWVEKPGDCGTCRKHAPGPEGWPSTCDTDWCDEHPWRRPWRRGDPAPDPDSPQWDSYVRCAIGRCVDHAMVLTNGSWHMHPHCKRELY
jgi:hypothetical protein